MSNSSIWTIDRIILGATSLGQLDLEAMAVKEYYAFPKAPALLEPHHQIVLCHIKDTSPTFAGPSGIRVGWGIDQWQIRGRKAPKFGWASFGWASCFYDSYAPLVSH